MKTAEETELKKEYATEYGTAEIIEVGKKFQIQIKFKCELDRKEKSAIINALKFKFVVCMPTYLQDNNYVVCVTQGIHQSDWRGHHFNGFYRDLNSGEKKSPILHFNLRDFKAENIPCITNITSLHHT